MSNIISIPMVANEMSGDENGLSESGDMDIIQIYVKSDIDTGFGIYVICLYLHGIFIAKEFYSKEFILTKLKSLILDPVAWLKEEDSIIKTMSRPNFGIVFPDEESKRHRKIIEENLDDIIIELEKYI